MPRMYYGAWYVEPDTWQRRHGRQVETRGGAEREDNTKVRRERGGVQASRDIILLSQVRLRAALPGAVDMMGFQQPVSQLQATKAFAAYLNEQKGYKKPVFIKHIIKSNDRHK